eukprot:TRINITY_DN4215_c0_g2_i2.p1 TRINITY_DN4215_c0_g2~~TRINITY_DN4215_c0_g2_i2.p1  ORF type:complete len:102 (-),score=1.18 TRINITY_DN4215_c0_g2_i2:9-314(-)
MIIFSIFIDCFVESMCDDEFFFTMCLVCLVDQILSVIWLLIKKHHYEDYMRSLGLFFFTVIVMDRASSIFLRSITRPYHPVLCVDTTASYSALIPLLRTLR